MTSRPLSELRGNSGFTLVEILMVLGLVAILSVAGITVMTGSVDESRYDATVAEMRQIRAAMVGDPDRVQGGTRSSFGYLGDIGSLPTSAQGLAALQAKPSGFPDFLVNATARIGVGWNGPYLATGASGGAFNFNDKWGRPYIYTPGATATIVSRGADGLTGGTGFNQDITMSIGPELQAATVYGFLSNGGAAYNNAFQVELNSANGSGGVSQTLLSVAAGTQGAFQFTNVPLGPRSATVYIPTKAAPTTTLGPIVFVVDKSRYMLPIGQFDLNPAGGGASGSSSGSTGGGNGVCSSNGGRIAFSPIIPISVGNVIQFRVNVSNNVNITGVRIDTPVDAQVNILVLDSRTYQCSGNRNFAPCPGPDSTNLLLSNNASMGSGNRAITLYFGSDVTNVSSMTVDITYTNGCDRLNVTGIL